MADYERVVEFLRDFRTASVQTVTDEAREAATAYAALCVTANERLRACAVLLQRGLRAEAINLADASPNLLDLVAALDLPDPAGWAEFCQRSDLPVPPALQIDRAAQLNDAYGQDQPLEELFFKHRRLALSQAPIGERLAVMREIAQIDGQPFWEKDIRTFELARFKELRVSFSSAVRERDVQTISALSGELLNSPWFEQVPPDLASAAQDVHARMRQSEFEGGVADLAGKLRSAFAARSHAECTTLLGQIKQLLDDHGRTELPAEFGPDISAAKAWVRQENQLRASREAFASACDALTVAMNADVPDVDLDVAYRAATGHDQPLPPALQERYDKTVAARAAAGRRKYILAFAGIAALLAVALGVGVIMMQRRVESGWADKIRNAAVTGDPAKARETVADQEKVAPQFNGSPAVVAAKREVAALLEKSNRDQEVLRKALADLGEAARAAEAARKVDDALSPEAVAEPHLRELRRVQSVSEEALARRAGVPDVSWVDPNKRLATTTAHLETARDDLKARIARAVLARAEGVARQADRVTADARADSLTAADKTLTNLEQSLVPLRPFAERGGAAESAIAAALKRIGERRASMGQSQELVAAKQALAANAATAASAAEALRDFAKRFPNIPSSRDFLRAAARSELNASVEAWHVLSVPWAADPAPADEKAVTQRLETLRGYVREHPASPFVPRANAYASYLEQMAAATAVQNSWQVAMADVLASPMVADLHYLETTEGTKYYVMGNPGIRRQQLNDRITFAFEALDPQNLSRRRQITLVPPRALKSDKPTPAPHAAYARTLGELLKAVDRTNWETFGPDLIDRIVAEEKIDVVVKATLLRDALTATAKAASWAASGAYDKVLGDLVRQRLDEVIWFDLDRPVAEVTITNLRRIFQSVPKAAAVKPVIAAKRAELVRSLQPMFGGVGMLLRDDAGKWIIQTRNPSKLAPAALAIVPPAGWVPSTGAESPTTARAGGFPESAPVPAAGAGTSGTFVAVATWKADRLVVDEAALRDLPEGTMVFLTKP